MKELSNIFNILRPFFLICLSILCIVYFNGVAYIYFLWRLMSIWAWNKYLETYASFNFSGKLCFSKCMLGEVLQKVPLCSHTAHAEVCSKAHFWGCNRQHYLRIHLFVHWFFTEEPIHIREHNKVGDGNRLMLKGRLKTCYPESG